MHGKVDFSKFNFTGAIYQVDENQMLHPSQKEPEATAAPPVAEPVTDANNQSDELDERADSTLRTEATISQIPLIQGQSDGTCASSSQTEEIVTKEKCLQVEKAVADKVYVCTIIKEEYNPPSDMQRIELIEYVKEQLPVLVDEFFKSKAQSCAGKVDENVSEEISAIKIAAQNEECNSGTGEIQSETENDAQVKPTVPCKLLYKFLFHENGTGEIFVIPGFEFRKVWFVQNTGTSSWPDNITVQFAENSTDLNLRESFVPKLDAGEIGGIYAKVVAPMSSGLYSMNFTLGCDRTSDYDLRDTEPLVCLVRVVENPLEFPVSHEKETVVPVGGGESANVELTSGYVEYDDTEMDPDDDITSTCEDETIYDSTDEDSELIDDFTVVPLPDCFDLNRVPALQSSLIQQRSCSEGSTQNHLDQLNALMGGQVAHDEEQFSNFGSCQEGLNDGNDEEFVVEDANETHDGTSTELTSLNTVIIASNETFHTPRGDETRENQSNVQPEMAEVSNSIEGTRITNESESQSHGPPEGSADLDDDVECPKSLIRVSASEERALLDRLTKLGFGDRAQNRQLLAKHDYNLQSVVKELINSFEPLR